MTSEKYTKILKYLKSGIMGDFNFLLIVFYKCFIRMRNFLKSESKT